jgi:hypothetical protein
LTAFFSLSFCAALGFTCPFILISEIEGVRDDVLATASEEECKDAVAEKAVASAELIDGLLEFRCGSQCRD